MFNRHLLSCVAVSFCCITPGCKWFGGERSSVSEPPSRSSGDPLLGMRIPPTDVPTRDGLAGSRRDPLLSTPAGRGRARPADADALPPRTSNDLGRAPYRPTLATTPAALAGFAPDADLILERGPQTPPAPDARDAVLRRLETLRAKVETPVEREGRFHVSATVPLGGDPPGFRRYTGLGSTATAALEHVLAQIESDQRN